ncbi:MAG TPA: nucleotidyltransferase domain-containing protein [Candidatus Brocadiia bacterium]|nr:nucleotidyltransferase domain-containing protein [Candidatus Brocadiales bacterium]
MKDYKRIYETYLDFLKQELRDNLVSVVLYGSVARGQYRDDSDIDLLIVCEDLPDDRFKRNEIFINIEDRLPEALGINPLEVPYISTISKTREGAGYHSPLYLDMVEDGKILFDKGGFIQKVFNDIKERLKELGAKRIWIGDKWYWDLKPDFKPGEVVEI